jgi:hypothetical protein
MRDTNLVFRTEHPNFKVSFMTIKKYISVSPVTSANIRRETKCCDINIFCDLMLSLP